MLGWYAVPHKATHSCAGPFSRLELRTEQGVLWHRVAAEGHTVLAFRVFLSLLRGCCAEANGGFEMERRVCRCSAAFF